MPPQWEPRAIVHQGTAQTAGATAIAPEIHDLAVSKLYARREKDLAWISSAIDAGYLQEQTLQARLEYLFKSPTPDGPKPD